MSQKKQDLLVGLDLGEQISQLSCFDEKKGEPVSIGRLLDDEGNREYEIKTALVAIPETGGWRFVEEDVPCDQGVTISNLLDYIRQGETFSIGEYQFNSQEVLKRYLIKLLSLLGEYYPDKHIQKLVISIPKKELALTHVLQNICEQIGIYSDRLVIQTHRQSYMYYAVSQPKELWQNNVGLFEFDQTGFIYSQINIDRRTTSWIVGVTQKDFSDIFDYSMLSDPEVDAGYAFVNVANTAMHKKMVTTLYVTGCGFEKEWAEDALKQLCNGRRVFRGRNIFTMGACYAAREFQGDGDLSQCLFLDEDMISSNLSIRVYHQGEVQNYLLAKAGTQWDEIDTYVDVIPDDEVEIQVSAQDVLRHETKTHMLSLSGFSNRPDKMSRFRIRVRFHNRETCIITLKDYGFGEICPTTNRIWERMIKV